MADSMDTREKVIWKFDLGIQAGNLMQRHYVATPKMPIGAVILSVGVQDNRLMVWAECDPLLPMEERQIHVVGTGANVIPGTLFVGRVQLGWYIGHVYA